MQIQDAYHSKGDYCSQQVVVSNNMDRFGSANTEENGS